MPRSNLCKPCTDPRETEVKALIAAGLARQNMDRQHLSQKTRIAKSTLNERLRKPREMRLGELWDILDVLKTDAADKVKIV